MSYILNALRKAETERRQSGPQQLDDLLSAGWDLTTKPEKTPGLRWHWPFLVAVVALLFVATWLVFNPLDRIPVVAAVEADAGEEGRPLMPETGRSGQVPPATHATNPGASSGSTLSAVPAAVAPIAATKVQPDAIGVSQPDMDPVAKIDVQGHVFIAEGSRLNRVFIGNRSYRQGESIDNVWRISKIGANQLILSDGDREFSLVLGH